MNMEKVRFDDFIKLNRGFDLPDDLIEKGIYPVVASTNIKAYHREYKVDGPMVITGRSGSLGKVQYINGKCWPLNTSLYVKDFKGNNPRYVYYYLQTMHLEQYNAGAGVPTLNQNHLHSLKLLIHSKGRQKEVASILSTYDTMIENNTKRIRLLEKMAENLYKEWFVRFRFPGHEKVEIENGLPKGWRVCQLSKISDYSNCKTPNNKGLFYISTENMLKEYGGVDETVPSECPETNVTKVEVGDILVSNIRPYFKKIWLADKEAGCSNDVLNIRAKKGISPIFLYYSIRRDSFFDHMVAGSNGTKMPRGSKVFTMKYSVIVPSNCVMAEFSRIIEPIIHNKRNLVYQNSLLAHQRDLLLPRLMSGKLEVKP